MNSGAQAATLLFAFWLALPSSGLAQAGDEPALTVDESRVAEAARAFAQAGAAFAEERYQQALEAFRRAHALAPHDQARFNIAVCLEELGRYREAAVEYDAVAQSDQLDAATRDRARTAQRVARTHLATLVLRSAHALLEVQLDGATTCAMPCETAVDPGEHLVTWEDESGAHERRLDILAGGRLEVLLGAGRPLGEPDIDGTDTNEGVSVGALGAIGIGVASLGVAGTIGFGLRALDVHDQYLMTGCGVSSLCEDGELARDLANVSIAVLSAGALMLVIDIAFVDD